MPYIYKYTDTRDDIVKYVGLIRNDTNFPKRFYQHKRDWWYAEGEWLVEYASVNSVCDAEALEGHFIAYYHTYDYFNKAKSTWGLLTFAPTVEWQKLGNPEFYFSEWGEVSHWQLDKRVDWADEQLTDIQRSLLRHENSLESLRRMLFDVADEARKKKFEDVRNWIRSRLDVPVFDPSAFTKDYAYVTWDEAAEDFCSFLGVPDDFVDTDDFRDIVETTRILPEYLKRPGGIIAEFRTIERSESA